MIDIPPLCNAVMRKVVASGCIVSDRSERDNCGRATEWMRHEVKAFFLADRYADARETAMGTPGMDNIVVSLIAATAIEGIISGKWPAKEG
jgi:hypothetical protein